MLLTLIALASAEEYRVGPDEGRVLLPSLLQIVQPGDVIVIAENYEPQTAGIWIEIDDLTIRGEGEGSEIEPIRVTGATNLVLSKLTIRSSSSSFSSGGASYAYVNRDHALVLQGGSVVMEESSFEGFSSYGPIWVEDADLTLKDVSFLDIEPAASGTNFLFNVHVGGADLYTVALQDVSVLSTSQMGAIQATSQGGRNDIVVTGGRFEGLYAPRGALVNWDVSAGAGTLTLSGVTADGNGSQDGEIYAKGGELRLDDYTSQGSTGGSLLYLESGSMEIYGSALLGGDRAEGGGSMRLVGSVVEIKRSMICGPTGQYEGDIWAEGGQLTLQNTTVQASSGPATLLSQDGTLKLENVSLIDNEQVAVKVEGAQDLSVVNALFQGSDLGLIVDDESHVDRVVYSLFWGNAQDVSGEDLLAGEGIVLDEEPTWALGLDPLACDPPMPLGDSPVIDRGDPALTDPWGGRSDIGTYGGPGSEDIGLEPSAGDTADIDDSGDTGALGPRTWRSGGSCQAGAGAGLLGLLGLLVLRRRGR